MADREYSEENVRYESSIVLPGSEFKKFNPAGTVVSYKGVDVYVFADEESAKDWMDDRLKTYFWNNRKNLILACKGIVGPTFKYSRYVDLKALAEHLVKNYGNPTVIPQTFRKRFRSDEEGKSYIRNNVLDAVDRISSADYRTSLLVFDFVDMDALVEDLEAHLGLRVFKQGSFYYVIDLYEPVLP